MAFDSEMDGMTHIRPKIRRPSHTSRVKESARFVLSQDWRHAPLQICRSHRGTRTAHTRGVATMSGAMSREERRRASELEEARKVRQGAVTTPTCCGRQSLHAIHFSPSRRVSLPPPPMHLSDARSHAAPRLTPAPPNIPPSHHPRPASPPPKETRTATRSTRTFPSSWPRRLGTFRKSRG